jgi:hypothetical protein
MFKSVWYSVLAVIRQGKALPNEHGPAVKFTSRTGVARTEVAKVTADVVDSDLEETITCLFTGRVYKVSELSDTGMDHARAASMEERFK